MRGTVETPAAPDRRAPARASLEELEQLWAAPAARPEPAAEGARAARIRPPRLGHVVAFGWVALVVGTIAMSPAAEPAATAGWVDGLSFLLGCLLIGAVATARSARSLAFAFSAAAGAVGVPLGIACRVTEHHLGAWWAVETAGFAGLAVASLAGAVLSARRVLSRILGPCA